jgi:hypothetical protein
MKSKQFSIHTERKQVPLPMVTFDLLTRYRDSLQHETLPGVTVSLHAAVHHALSLASSVRNIQDRTEAAS